MINSLKTRLTLLFLAFALLVITSVGMTALSLQAQQQDALVINLAGRQRMLLQQMARLALSPEAAGDTDDASAFPGLAEAAAAFDQTLSALRLGGSAPYTAQNSVQLLPAAGPDLRAVLDSENQSWAPFYAAVRVLLDASASPAERQAASRLVEAQASAMVAKADLVVQLYEAAATARVNQVRLVQFAFLAAALGLLGVGAWVTSRSVLQPLAEFEHITTRVGENDLETPIQVSGPLEIQALSQSFEQMRQGLGAARQELVELNQNLEARVLQRTRELDALNEVSREISSRLDIQQVLTSVADKARSLLGGEVASLCLIDENRHWLKLQTISGPAEAVVGDTVAVDGELSRTVLAGSQALQCGVGSCQGGCAMLAQNYRASHLAAPLRSGDRVIGALCVGSPTHQQFAAESADVLTKLANTAAIALENARLYAQAERVATLEERHRIAAEMHDGLGQTLSYLGLMTDQVVDFLSDGQDQAALDRLSRTRNAIEKATGDVRRAINSLLQEPPPNANLCQRLQGLVTEVSSRHKLAVTWQSDMDEVCACSAKAAEQVLRIAGEALSNTARHAHSSQVSLHLQEAGPEYCLLIEDNGQGFDPARPAASPDDPGGGHFGLQIMRARAEQIGGSLDIFSSPGQGTRLVLTWPKDPQAER